MHHSGFRSLLCFELGEGVVRPGCVLYTSGDKKSALVSGGVRGPGVVGEGKGEGLAKVYRTPIKISSDVKQSYQYEGPPSEPR